MLNSLNATAASNGCEAALGRAPVRSDSTVGTNVTISIRESINLAPAEPHLSSARRYPTTARATHTQKAVSSQSCSAALLRCPTASDLLTMFRVDSFRQDKRLKKNKDPQAVNDAAFSAEQPCS